MYRDFWHLYIKEYGGLREIVLLFILSMVVAFLEGINIGLVIPLFEVLESGNEGGGHWITDAVISVFSKLGIPFNLGTLLLAFAVLISGMAGLKYWRMLWISRTQLRFTLWTRDWTMGNYVHSDLSYFHKKKLGMMSQTYLAQCASAGSSLQAMNGILGNLGVALVFLVTAFVVSPVLTGVAFAMLMVVTLMVQYNIIKAKRIGAAMVGIYATLNTSVLETLSGIHVIKSFLQQHRRRDEVARGSEAFGEIQYQERKNQSQTQVIQESSTFALIAGITYVGVSIFNIEFSLILALLFVLYRLAPRVTALNDGRQALAVSLAALHHVRNTLDETANPSIISGDRAFEDLKDAIQLKDVTFSYNGGAPVIDNTGFTIEKGKVTAIVGTSGAGKTTLIDLLLRHYDPAQGIISVDGTDLKELDLDSWRKAIGVVSQDVFLFHDTVANNISLGRPGVTMEDIQRAAKQAYAHDFVQQMPQGYDTPIGDRGWNLSGGQRQRLALARAILLKPEILILDEATSSLDSESERLIQDSIDEIKANCTLVVVAHRLSTIRDADRIVVLQDGKVVEEGDWDSLLAEDGVLANYHRLQAGVR